MQFHREILLAPRTILLLLRLLFVWLLLSAGSAGASLTIEIVGAGANQIPVAIVPFRAEQRLAQRITPVVAADLARSGLFKTVDPGGMNPVPYKPEQLNYGQWRARGAEAVVSSKQMEKNALWKGKSLEYYYAAATMHEMGHTMGIRNGHPAGCDMSSTKLPIQLGWWIYRTYKSIMNYEYTYRIFDYSDGSHGIRDFDDWSNLNLSHFEIPEVNV